VRGPEVLRFDGLLDEIVRRTATAGRPIGELTRERLVRVATERAGLRVLAESAATPGFPRAAGRLFAELVEA